jgi:hypothetical protein
MSESEMAAAIRRQMDACARSMEVDRRDWTRQQWIDDARRLMDEIDGAVTSLVNGHVMALLDAVAARDTDQGAGAAVPLCPVCREPVELWADLHGEAQADCTACDWQTEVAL